MVPSSGFTSAYTRVTAGPTGSVPVESPASVAAALSVASAVASAAASVFWLVVVSAASGAFSPQAVMETTIAAHNSADKTFFFM